MKGMIALRSAPYAFNYFNKYTAWFPIRVEISMDLEGLWTVDMLVSAVRLQSSSLLTRNSLRTTTKIPA